MHSKQEETRRHSGVAEIFGSQQCELLFQKEQQGSQRETDEEMGGGGEGRERRQPASPPLASPWPPRNREPKHANCQHQSKRKAPVLPGEGWLGEPPCMTCAGARGCGAYPPRKLHLDAMAFPIRHSSSARAQLQP